MSGHVRPPARASGRCPRGSVPCPCARASEPDGIDRAPVARVGAHAARCQLLPCRRVRDRAQRRGRGRAGAQPAVRLAPLRGAARLGRTGRAAGGGVRRWPRAAARRGDRPRPGRPGRGLGRVAAAHRPARHDRSRPLARRRARRPRGRARVRGLLRVGAGSARRRARRATVGSWSTRRPTTCSPPTRRRCGGWSCGARVATSRSRRTTRSTPVRPSTDAESAGSFGRCRRTKSWSASWSSPRTPTTSTSAPPGRSRRGPTPASRWRTASAPTATPAASTPTCRAAEIGRHPPGRAAGRGQGGRASTDVALPRLPRRPADAEHRAAPRHQPGHPPGPPAAGADASRRSATGTGGSTPAHPDHLAAGEAAIAAVYPDARNPFAHPELLAAEGLEAWAVSEVWLMAGRRRPTARRHHRHLRAQARGPARARQPDRPTSTASTRMPRGWLSANAVAPVACPTARWPRPPPGRHAVATPPGRFSPCGYAGDSGFSRSRQELGSWK